MATVEVIAPIAKGVELIPSTDSDFDTRVRAMDPRLADLLQDLKPFLVIVVNHNDRTIVGYDIAFEIVDAKTTQKILPQFKYPDALRWTKDGLVPRGREIRPGESRLVNPYFEIDPSVDNRPWLTNWIASEKEEFGSPQSLRVSVDAVIFDDGELLGPDRSDLASNFLAYFQAKETVYRKILDELSIRSVAESFHSLEPLHKAAVLAMESTERTPFSSYLRLAIEDLFVLRKQVGDHMIVAVVKDLCRDVDLPSIISTS